MIICLVDTLFSVLAGFTVFSTLGILAKELNTTVENVVESSKLWASSRQNLSSGFPTNRCSNQSPQLQRPARKLKFCL